MQLNAHGRRSAAYKPALAWFVALGSAWVFVLVTMGAFTTSIGAGMVFPDWPLSNGSLNPEGWLSDIAMFAEHSHRLSAGIMSAITITIAVWVWRSEARGWLRWLGVAAVVLVFIQALVGGLRVLLEKHHVEMIGTSVGRLFAMLHAGLAQVFVCTLVAIAAGLSRGWIERRGDAAPLASGNVRRLGVACCVLLLVQLGVAAVMRHSFAGLAISTFPHSTANGDWLPAGWDFRVAIHFAHRAIAVVLAAAVTLFSFRIFRENAASGSLKLGAAGLIVLLAVQISLGAYVVWSGRHPHVTTAHVIVGAVTLAGTFLITWWLHRDLVERAGRDLTASEATSSRANLPFFKTA